MFADTEATAKHKDMHEISLWLESMGIPPLLGGLVAGAVLGWLLSRLGAREKSAVVLGAGSRATTGNRTPNNQTRGADDVRAGSHFGPEGDFADLSEQELKAVYRHLQQGEKIAAIKLLRERTGLGLAESKKFVENLEDNGGRR